MPADKLLTRVVKGPHSFDHCDAEGNRTAVAPGEEVQVTPSQAVAFKDVLIDPQVLVAEQQAEEIKADVEKQVKEQAASLKSFVKPKETSTDNGPSEAAAPGTGKGKTK